MKVLIIADMEGISGITGWAQVHGDGSEKFQEGRRLMTEDANAAVRGAKRAGATEIVIAEYHGSLEPYNHCNILPELLDADCEWAAHYIGLGGPVFKRGFDAAVFVGLHARSGTLDGVCPHTASRMFKNLWMNDRLVGEIDLAAAICGQYGVPIVFASGDTAACRQAKESLGHGLVTVAVKEGINAQSAICIAPVRARRMIEDGVATALSGPAPKPFVVGPPVRVVVEFHRVEDTAPLVLAGAKMLEPQKFCVEAPTFEMIQDAMVGSMRG